MFQKLSLIVVAILSFASITYAIDSSQSLAVMGDSGEASSELDKLKKSVLKEQIQSVVMPGDNLYAGTYEQVWNSWKSTGFNFDVTAIGNHNSGYATEVKYFAMPGEYYSTVKNGARFIVLNSDNTKNVAEQFTFLNKEVLNAKEKLIFVVYHHPTFTVTSSHVWTEKKDFQLKMRDFLRRQGQKISALILGHDHITSFIEFGRVPVILAGSGREVRSAKAVSFPEDGFQIETKYLAPKVQHWVKMDISAAGDEAVLNVIRVSDNAKVCTAQLRQNAMTLGTNCK